MSRYYRPSNLSLEQNVFPANPFSSYQCVTNIPYARNSNKTVQQPEITVISPPLPEIDHGLISGLDACYQFTPPHSFPVTHTGWIFLDSEP